MISRPPRLDPMVVAMKKHAHVGGRSNGGNDEEVGAWKRKIFNLNKL